MRTLTLLFLLALSLAACVFEAHEAAPNRDYYYPPRFLLDSSALTDTLGVGDTVRVALQARGDSIILGTSRPDARADRDSLLWIARPNDTGLNNIVVRATDRFGAEDSVAFRFFVRRFGRYHPMVAIKTGMDGVYASAMCDPIRGSVWVCGAEPYRNHLDTLRYHAISDASVSFIRSSDSSQTEITESWDGGETESDLTGKFGFNDIDNSCPGQYPASQVDTVELSRGTKVVRVAVIGLPCDYSIWSTSDNRSTSSYYLINHYYVPGIGLIFTRKYSVTDIISLHGLYPTSYTLEESALVEFGGEPFDYRRYVASADSLLPPHP